MWMGDSGLLLGSNMPMGNAMSGAGEVAISMSQPGSGGIISSTDNFYYPFNCEPTPQPAQNVSSPMTFGELTSSPIAMQENNNGFNQVYTNQSPGEPFLNILIQPINRIRYRYKSEKGSHGGLTGKNSMPNKKTYPTLKLENYRGNREVILKASLYTSDEKPKLHVHKLMGRNCNDSGVCTVRLREDMTAVFQNLGIRFMGKKEVPEILYKRKLEDHGIHSLTETSPSGLTESEKKRLRDEADREAKDMNLNSVKICFEAFCFDQMTQMFESICPPVFSDQVANQKSPDSGELKIVRMDKYSGVCTGDEEVFLLCEKVNKKEIKIRFYEMNNNGDVCWEDFASFSEADVHHQVAIVFRTPAYKTLDIDKPVPVYLQLFRKKDGEASDPKPFIYHPVDQDKEGIERKRKKLNHYQNFGFPGSSSGTYGPSAPPNPFGSGGHHQPSDQGNGGMDGSFYGHTQSPRGYQTGSDVFSGDGDISCNEHALESEFLSDTDASLSPEFSLEEINNLSSGYTSDSMNNVLSSAGYTSDSMNNVLSSANEGLNEESPDPLLSIANVNLPRMPGNANISSHQSSLHPFLNSVLNSTNLTTDSAKSECKNSTAISKGPKLRHISAEELEKSLRELSIGSNNKKISSTPNAAVNRSESFMSRVKNIQDEKLAGQLTNVRESGGVITKDISSKQIQICERKEIESVKLKYGDKYLSSEENNSTFCKKSQFGTLENNPSRKENLNFPQQFQNDNRSETGEKEKFCILDRLPSNSDRSLTHKIFIALTNFVVSGDMAVLLRNMSHLIPIRNEDGDNLLHLAILHQSHNIDLMNHLLHAIKELSPSPLDQPNDMKQTPVHLATLTSNREILKLLLANGGNPNVSDRNGNSSLHLAVETKDLDCLLELLNQKNYLSENQRNFPKLDALNYKGLSPLHLGILCKAEKCVIHLCKAGADVNVIEGTRGKTPLHMAVEHCPSLVKHLLKQPSINVDAQDFAGNTPLHLACAQAMLSSVHELMIAEANPLIQNYDQSAELYKSDTESSAIGSGKTPLDFANGNKELVGILAGEGLPITPSSPTNSHCIPQKLKNDCSPLTTKHFSIRKSSFESSHQTNSTDNNLQLNQDSDFKKKIGNIQKNETAHDISRKDVEDSCRGDSGYISGKISMLDDLTLQQVCSLLDPPNTAWKDLALFLGMDEHFMDGICKLKSSPTQAIIENFERNGGEASMLHVALQHANLSEAKLVVERYLDSH